MKTKLRQYFIVVTLLAGLVQTARATVGFTVTPPAVSNTYSGYVTLQITGLTSGETVVVQKFLDLNDNGVIDDSDWLVQQFNLTDGQAGMVIGGVTNINVPDDLNTASGDITAALNFQNGDFMQNIIGDYLYKLSSPADHFTPRTSPFTVTNFPFLQTIAGNVVSNGTSATVPDALVLLFSGPQAGQSGLGHALGGVVANNAGTYTIRKPQGTYELIAVSSNYVFSYAALPVVTLATGQTVTTNLTLTAATASIPGKVVDANNKAIGLAGVLIHAETTNSMVSATFTDSNGDFNLPANSDTWRVNALEEGLMLQGYVGWGDGTNVSAGTAPVVLAFSKATALIYGSVEDNLGNPLPALDVYADDDNGLFAADIYTDAKGNYVLGVMGLGASDSWYSEANGDNQLTNYVFSPGHHAPNVNISAGQAVLRNFIAILATNHISGSLEDNYGNPIPGIEIYAGATTNGVDYDQEADTDNDGNYWLNVPNGNWDVEVAPSWWGGNDSLPDNYSVPPTQSVIISNNNAVVNFIATLVNNPKPSLSSPAKLSNGQFQFLLTGAAGQNYTIQMSTNLSSTNWASLFTTNNAVTNSFNVVDSHATNQQRFYRVLVGP